MNSHKILSIYARKMPYPANINNSALCSMPYVNRRLARKIEAPTQARAAAGSHNVQPYRNGSDCDGGKWTAGEPTDWPRLEWQSRFSTLIKAADPRQKLPELAFVGQHRFSGTEILPVRRSEALGHRDGILELAQPRERFRD